MSDVRVIIQRDSEREEHVVTTGTTAADLFPGQRTVVAARVEGELRSRGVVVLDVAYDARVRLLLAAAPEGAERLDELVAAGTGRRSLATRVGERWVDVTD